MSQESEDISKWIQELITRSSRQQVQAMQRLGGLVQRMTSGELDQNRVREEYTHFIQDESTRFVEDLTRLGLSFQTALLELNRKYSDRFFDQVLGSSVAESQPNGQPSQRKEVEMALSGSPGNELVRTFVIENKRGEEETVTFLVSEFTDAQGNHSFRPPLQLQPARLNLRPGEERAVTLRLPLLPELFQAGERYTATIIARGHSDVTLLLSVAVEAAAAPPETGLAIRTPAPAAQPAVKGEAGPAPSDDLTEIRGIGPAFTARLNQAGIHTFAELAKIDADRLGEIIGKEALARLQRYPWREQAQQAAQRAPASTVKQPTGGKRRSAAG